MAWLKKGWYYILPILALVFTALSDQKIDRSLLLIVIGVLLLMVLMDISKYRMSQAKKKTPVDKKQK
ncbi:MULTISPECIES: hypothetical protein [Brochothrix]|uniref:Uncharacterized protein n=1 Tax=Brochothrix thermosphacta TaxID=2756 RepID=A0A1D2KDQ6_BROTH|nr:MULTISPECIES: hypothetical protein [Brochothrix]SLM91646.1 hypothetical protein FM106_03775 [Brachybacterium faecium]ANZ94900.1 hypothetical protein BFC19_05640 [Brochothrix thermosphacta]ANZ96800.1 hypothetical protein BFC20_03155 [Brochothrix thermosphacta]ATF26213.1 hypothetical protein CNY62_07305 [Brochothrix thermosphacta]ATH85552.1 hypothetical protein CPF12_06890 [Brochothrix thermosphacta]